jgi:hypothetical protein
MKHAVLYGTALSTLAVSLACARPRPQARPDLTTVATAHPPAPEPREVFAQTVQPILARTCAPCHAPGGKMYDRLPFDKPEVVRDNREGILRRLKVPDDREAVERWLGSVRERI